MAKLVFGMSQSLDGYVDGVAGDLELPPPGPALFHHFYEWVRDLTGSVYGRRMYEVMRIGTKTVLSGARSNATSRRCGDANRSG